MTKATAKKFMPMVKALSEGKTIQHRNFNTRKWQDLKEPMFISSVKHYRIKPEAKA